MSSNMLHFIYLFVTILLENKSLAYPHTDQSIKEEQTITNISQEVKTRIRMGETAGWGHYPWMTYIMYTHFQELKPYVCGGSIITHRHVLTAGHCCSTAIPSSMRVRAGEFNTKMNPDCKFQMLDTPLLGHGCESYYTDYEVENISSYNPLEYKTFPSGDICIIKVSKDIVFTDFIHEINMPFGDGWFFKSNVFWGKYLIAIGWGAINEANGQTTSNVLMKGELKVLKGEECKNKWRPIDPHIADNIGDEHICAGSSRGSTVCPGDSGGPLMLIKEGKTYLIGVVSVTFRCTPSRRIDVPGIFTRPDRYKDWLEERMK